MGILDNFLGKKDQAEPEETESSESNTGYKKVDVNKPLENFRLNVLLKETKENQTETGMNMLFEEIVMNAHFLSVIFLSELPKPNEDGTATFQKNTTMHQGKNYGFGALRRTLPSDRLPALQYG